MPKIVYSTVMRFVYILLCKDNTYYTGITNDVEKRIFAHNNEKIGAKYTKSRRPVTLVWTSQAIEWRWAATLEERRIKKLTRKKKEELIKS